MSDLVTLTSVAVLSAIGFHALGKLRGYKEGLRDGIELEREAWNDEPDDGGPDGDGEPVAEPITLDHFRGPFDRVPVAESKLSICDKEAS